MFNIFQQPWTLLIAAIVAWLILLVIHGDSRLWWQTHLVIFLAVAIFALDFLVEAGLFKISKVLTIIIQATLALAIAVLLTLQIIHVILTYERHWWQWLLPIILAVAAFGLDFVVQTDLERINALISTVRKATEQENCDAIGAIISADYSDSYHNGKDDLMNHCRRLLSEPLVEKSMKMGLTVEISPPRAAVTLTVIIHFDKQSRVYREYRPFVILKIQFDLHKEQGKRWLVNRAEILEIDRQPVKWRDIR
ncbi:MAG TPA: hypothetical protein VMY06_09775 [Sedimentisphaerales bacterium]|nr:hypothetical protein [Sedimentisphaerales bacterium]